MTGHVADDVLARWTRRVHDWEERILKGSLDSDVVTRVVQKVIDQGQLASFFISPSERLELTQRRNQERNWGFSGEQFTEAEKTMPSDEGEGLCIWTLRISSKTVQQTFEEAWHFTAKAQKELDAAGSWRWNQIQSDPDHLRLYQGIDFKPMTLEWKRIDLGANINKSPSSIRQSISPNLLPHSEILWEASFSPKWIQSMGTEVGNIYIPYVDVPGYEVNTPAYEPWSYVPHLFWFRDYREVELSAHHSDDADPRWGVPLLRE